MNDATGGMHTTVETVTEIGAHLQAIANAAQEQAAALQEVNGAAATIDQGTPQNAAMVPHSLPAPLRGMERTQNAGCENETCQSLRGSKKILCSAEIRTTSFGSFSPSSGANRS